MSFMFEVYYRGPEDADREAHILALGSQEGGRLDYREAPSKPDGTYCLTFEFAAPEQAETAAANLRRLGEYVKGPGDYV